MAKYTVSLRIDGRVDVTVEAASFDEAFAKAPSADFAWNKAELVDLEPVNATDETGKTWDYGCHGPHDGR